MKNNKVGLAILSIKNQLNKEKSYLSTEPQLFTDRRVDSHGFKPRWVIITLIAIGFIVIFPGAGHNRPLESHEAYVPLVAAEMLKSGNFIVPYFNGIPRLQKPPLAYWLVASVYTLTGADKQDASKELKARSPSIVAALALLFITAGIGYWVSGDARVGWIAAALLATSRGFFTFGMNARPEMLYALFCAVQLFGFLYLQRAGKNWHDTIAASLMLWGGFAGAVLAKGPIFPIFFIISVTLGLLVFRSRPSWRMPMQIILGLLTVMVLVAYFMYVAQLTRGAGKVWAQQVMQSSSTPIWLLPFQNKFYFLDATVELMKPWIVLLPLALFAVWRFRRPEMWVLCFIVVIPILLLSFSGKMREHYVLPILPMFFVLMSQGLVFIWNISLGNAAWRSRLWLTFGGHVLFFAGSIIVLGVQAIREAPEKNIDSVFYVLPFLLTAFLVLFWAWRHRLQKTGYAFAGLILAAAFLNAGVGAGGLDWKTQYYTNAEFGKAIATYAKKSLVVNESGYHSPAIIFYSDRQMPSFHFSELDKLLKDNPRALIVTEAENIERAGIEGEIVLQERITKKKSRPQVLFKPFPKD